MPRAGAGPGSGAGGSRRAGRSPCWVMSVSFDVVAGATHPSGSALTAKGAVVRRFGPGRPGRTRETSGHPGTTRASEADDRLRLAEHARALAGHGEVDTDRAGVRVHRADGPGHLERSDAGVRHGHGAREARLVVDDGARVAGPVLDEGHRGAQREHAVGDDAGQAHLGGERVVPVDRVEVAARAGVPHEAGTVDLDRAGADHVTDRQVGQGGAGGLGAHAPSPRTARVEVTVETGSVPPSGRSAAISQRVVTIARPARSTIESTCSTVTSSSPATIGRWWVKRSSAWTTREKSMPAS